MTTKERAAYYKNMSDEEACARKYISVYKEGIRILKHKLNSSTCNAPELNTYLRTQIRSIKIGLRLAKKLLPVRMTTYVDFEREEVYDVCGRCGHRLVNRKPGTYCPSCGGCIADNDVRVDKRCGNCTFLVTDEGSPYCCMKDLYTFRKVTDKACGDWANACSKSKPTLDEIHKAFIKRRRKVLLRNRRTKTRWWKK